MSKNNFVEVTIDPPVFTETVIIPGKQGIQGDKGDPGATPNIQIGTVETLPAESPATASMTGTPESPLLNLGIPQGNDGVGINVTGATVGQTVRIAAVDDNGVPTAWEAVDFEKKWELITDTTIAEADASTTLFVDKKDTGESFNLHELCIVWIGIAVTDGTASGKAWISLNPTKPGYNQGKCGWFTNSYFYYTSIANYLNGVSLSVKPYFVWKTDGASTSKDANTVYQNGISSIEVSAYQAKSFYGRVIIYGR